MPVIKPAIKSSTLQSAVLIGAASIVSFLANPDLYTKLSKTADTFEKPGLAKVLRDLVPVVTFIGSIGAIKGRLRVGDLYTPKGILGPDKEKLLEKENQESDQISLLKSIHQKVVDSNKVPFLEVDIQKLANDFDQKNNA
jgi:hypothetical protein